MPVNAVCHVDGMRIEEEWSTSGVVFVVATGLQGRRHHAFSTVLDRF